MAEAPRKRKRRIDSTKSVGQMLLADELEERAPRIGARDHGLRADLLAAFQHDAFARLPCEITTLSTGALQRISAPAALRRRCDRGAHRAVAALGEPPGAEHAVELAHVVVQQHVRGAGRARAEQRADDAARRLGRLERLGLEPLVEEIRRAHGEELASGVLKRFAPRPWKCSAEPLHARTARASESDVGSGGAMASSGFTARAIWCSIEPELVVGLGVAQRMARELAPVLVVVVPLRQVVPLFLEQGVSVLSSGRMCRPWRGSSSSRMISGRSRLTTYENTEKRKPGNTSSRHRRAADALAPLEDQHLAARRARGRPRTPGRCARRR